MKGQSLFSEYRPMFRGIKRVVILGPYFRVTHIGVLECSLEA